MLLGADYQGRDLVTRLLYGLRLTLAIGATSSRRVLGARAHVIYGLGIHKGLDIGLVR